MVTKPTNFIDRIKSVFKFQETQDIVQNENVKRVDVHTSEIGSTGIEIYAGYYYEDYLRSLDSKDRADLFDKMRRSDPKLTMLLGAVKNPIKAGHFHIEEGIDGDPLQEKMAEFVEHVLFNDMDKTWTALVHEILSCVDFGHSVFEMVDKIVIGHKKFGNYTGLKTVSFRSQRTIQTWNIDDKTGQLLSITQNAYGDLSRYVQIPAEFLLVFTLNKEGDNYEGISFLRPCLGAFKRKEHHLKAEAIGIEKFAIPTPILDIPPGKENSTELETAKLVMQKYVSHQQQYITKPQDWKIDFLKTDFKAGEIRNSINAENTEMVNAFLANFLDLGTNGAGSYALSFDLSDFFLTSIEHIANYICEEINRTLITRLIDLNFGPQEVYPKLCVGGITEKAGKELAEVIKFLVDSKVIIPDDKLEDVIRDRYKLPAKSTEGQREVQKPAPFGAPQMAEKKAKVFLLEEPKKQIKQDQEVIQQIMQTNLQTISDNLISQIMQAYRNLPESKKLDAIKGVTDSGVNDYKNELLNHLAVVSTNAIKQARKEVPKAKNVKFAEKLDSVKLAEFEQLPPELQRLLKARSDLLVGSQIADLKKAIFFAYNNAALSTDSESQLQFDLNEDARKYVMGPASSTGAANIASQVVNESRNAFFFDEEVSQQIESFTFTNADPISPICQDLNGTVFSKDDPNLDRYWPPLHHNCKSYIVPNLVGNNNPDLTEGGLKPSKSSLDKYVTLSEGEGLALQSCIISKELAHDNLEAKSLAMNYKCSVDNAQELETGYKFINMDQSLFADGTIRSFSPMQGVTLFVGILRPQDDSAKMAEDNKWKLQTIVVSKDKAKSVEEAKAIAKELGADTVDKVDETESSYRFRQIDPSGFVDSSFRTKAIPKKGASLVYGRLK